MPHAVVVNTIPSAVPRFKSAGGTLNVFFVLDTPDPLCGAAKGSTVGAQLRVVGR